ncbi:germ cell-specific gene 1-like protein [Sinocyclocheilus grahami]|uniref:germ cell-specific gene 1-like protein n=1 Tax=Sinocyclocheilus grahami TaxID=75366 RepID=UPI0007AC7294|nr:PREDICTED: germ cell-specific gene 1-like protein [Sinocyclocheilus grahami]
MLDHMSRRSRSLVSLFLTSLALALSVLAFCTSYWCEGTHKVVKPLCLSPVKMKNCGQNNSEPYTTESPTSDPQNPLPTLLPKRREELARIRQRQLANAVHYIWETGEDKYTFRYFHTGFWESCEKHADGERCRRFLDLTPGETHGVLWLSMIAEFMYISLLGMGFLLMWVEVLCAHKEMHALKINAFAAICTVLSGLLGMVAHMMYTTVFQLTVIVGPKDWRPQTWDYGWSFALAWVSFSCCMCSAVMTLNSYTKTVIEQRHRQRLRLEEARATSHAPSYDEVVPGGGLYSVSGLLQCPNGMIDSMWVSDGSMGLVQERDVPTLVLFGGCGQDSCEDCEREMDEMKEAMNGIDSPC